VRINSNRNGGKNSSAPGNMLAPSSESENPIMLQTSREDSSTQSNLSKGRWQYCICCKAPIALVTKCSFQVPSKSRWQGCRNCSWRMRASSMMSLNSCTGNMCGYANLVSFLKMK
jgi:hypothetical protein